MTSLRPLLSIVVASWIAASAIAADITVSTLNGYFLFKPGSKPGGQLEEKGPADLPTYERKLENLSGLIRDAHIVALQEIGSAAEPADLARLTGSSYLFTQGKDTYTGEDVALLYRLPAGFKYVRHGREPSLDKALSKHLLAVFSTPEGKRMFVLAVHMLRPAGKQAERHQGQIDAIAGWARRVVAEDPGAIIVIAGDTNNDAKTPGTSLFGIGREAGELTAWRSTFAGRNLPIDRIIVAGPASIRTAHVVDHNGGRSLNDTQRVLWTDHYVLRAVVTTR